MNNFAFCTITYGEKYITLGDVLIKQLNDLGCHVFVMTNDINHYSPNELLTVIEYTKPYFSFHEKRIIMQECLKHYDSAIFLDADVIVDNLPNLDPLTKISPGLHIFATFGNLGNSFLNDDVVKHQVMEQRNTKYGVDGLDLLNSLNLKYQKEFHGIVDYLEHYLEGKWILKKDGNENEFFNIWDKLAGFCESKDIELGFTNNIGAGEGAVMSIAAENSGLKLNVISPLCTFINTYFISNYQEKVNGTKPWNIAG
jgi:hypothetical protein